MCAALATEIDSIASITPLSEPIAMEEDAPAEARTVSFFEFWPGWIMYLPVGLQWVILALRHRSLTLPFLANPNLTLSGMVGVGKSELMQQAIGKCEAAILPWVACKVSAANPQEQADIWVRVAARSNIHLPFVCKPDIGCRGVGVKLVKDAEQLADVIANYPEGTSLLCQKLASFEPEVGIFYVKDPVTKQGDIVSMTAKHLPTVTGDGTHSLGELIAQDARAGQLQHLYYERHKASWDDVPAHGEIVRLVFSASHSKGAIFRDARAHITPELKRAITDIMDDLPHFYYGRLDVKYPDLASLQKGAALEIIEINAASSESTHIWDRNTRFRDAVITLLWQYRTLFRLGAHHRKQGRKAPSLRTFLRHLRIERKLAHYYPHTD